MAPRYRFLSGNKKKKKKKTKADKPRKFTTTNDPTTLATLCII